MLPGPIFRREVRAASGRELLKSRFWMVVTLAIFVLLPAPALLDPSIYPARDRVSPAGAARVYAGYVFAATVVLEIVIMALSAAGAVAVSIAGEREKDTLPLLLLTRLTRLELAATKLLGRLLPTLLTMLTGLPLIVLGAWFAGLPASMVVQAMALIMGATAVGGGLGILASSRRDRSATAVLEAGGGTLAWLVALPIVSLMPVRSGTLWGDLLVELRRIAGWLAPSSPMSLVIDPSWFLGSGDVAGALASRIAPMLAMQAGLVAAALAGAVGGLRLREPHPLELDPSRGFRPPIGDDPIFWREFEMPYRALRGLSPIMLARRLWVVLKTILLLALQAMLLAAVAATLIGGVVAAGWYGYHAFCETWGFAAPTAGASVAREQLNGFILLVTFMLGLLPMMGAPSVEAQITLERDKKTWEPLLMTPMTGPEILGSKRRVVARTLWAAYRCLIPLWLLGIVCGVVHPMGVVLSAVGLATGSRLGMALGLHAAIRPRARPKTAQVQDVAWHLPMLVIGSLTVVAPLVPPHAYEGVRGMPWGGVAGLLAIAVAAVARERSLTRRCFERFDEWVGRPHRAAGAGRDEDAPAGPEPVASIRDESRTPSAAGVH